VNKKYPIPAIATAKPISIFWFREIFIVILE
jgi:hypothetical protein